MSWFGRLFRRRALDRDLDREIRFHIDSAADDLVRAGHSHDDARRLARIELGGVERVKEEARDARGTGWAEDFATDVRHALRGMRRAPAFSAAAILTLAVGIGANTAVWSIGDALLRRSLPIERPGNLYAIHRVGIDDAGGDANYQVSYPLMRRMRGALPDSMALAGMSSIVRLYATITDQPEAVTVQLVSGDFFHVLGMGAERGRLIDNGDDRDLGSAPVAVISNAFWERGFGHDLGIVGRRVRISGIALTIIGVAPAGFAGLTVGVPVDVYVPVTMQHEVKFRGNASSSNSDREKPWVPQNGISWLTLITRQTPANAALARSRLEGPFHANLVDVMASRDSAARAYHLRERVLLEPIPRGFSPLRDQFGDPLRLLAASVGLLLLIMCANLAALMLARSVSRTHEIALRLSLGARRSRLVRQVLTESLVIAVIGGALGLLVTRWATRALLTLASSGTRPIPLDAVLDARVLAFALALAVAAGLLFGLAPAFRAGRLGLYDAFRTGGRVMAARGSHRVPLGRALIIAQIALSLLLVTAAGLFARTFQNLMNVDVGYERQRLVTARLDVRAAGYASDELPALHQRLLAALRAIPGVRSASLSYSGIANGSRWTSNFSPPGRALPQSDNSGQENDVTPDYFRTVGIDLIAGRAFAETDASDAPAVVILSRSAARKFLGRDSVVGAHFGYGTSQPWTIVGVVRDARVNSLRESPPPMIYHPLAQSPSAYIASAEIRTVGNPAGAIAGMRAAIQSVDHGIPLRDVVTMESLLERGLTNERMLARLSAGFGALALVLVAIGLYGVVSFSVARRTNEMGVRLALGASRAAVLWIVLRDSLVTIGAGLIVGVVLWLPLLSLAHKLVYGLSPHDASAVVVGGALLFGVGMLGALAPAVRAAQIDPIDAIRTE